ETVPNARHLATALMAVANLLPMHRWPVLQWHSSWPLAVCLRTATSPEELRQFAEQLRSGNLGDVQEWYSAQEEWTKQIDLLAVLDTIEELAPWSPESLKRAPPFLALPFWSFEEPQRKQKSQQVQ